MLGLMREEVTGDWRKMYNEELHGLYSSPNIIWVIKSRRMGWDGWGNVTHGGEKRHVYTIMVGKLEGKRPLGRCTHRWEGMGWINLARDKG